jgi:hypothetical protein
MGIEKHTVYGGHRTKGKHNVCIIMELTTSKRKDNALSNFVHVNY